MIDVFGYLESVKYRYHLRSADIWNGMIPDPTDEDFIKKVRRALDERDLVLANLCVDGAHPWEPDPQAREENHQRALAYLRAAEILGAQSVRIDMGGRDEVMTDEQFDYTVSRYQEYAKRAHDNGYKVGPENHWGCARVRENMEKLIEAVDHPAFGILLHFENWTENEQENDRFFAKHAFHTHLAAWVEPRFEEKIQHLIDAGYQGHLGVEHHSATDEYLQVEWQLASVRRALRTVTSNRE